MTTRDDRAARPVLRGVRGRRALPAPARAHGDRGRQRAVLVADDEHAGAAPGRRVLGDAAVRAAPDELDVDARDDGRAHRSPSSPRARSSPSSGSADIAFPHPLFHGDTLYTETEIVERSGSRRRGPVRGSSRCEHTGRNQDDVVVATATRVALMWCRDAATAAPGRSPHERFDPAPRCCSARPTAPSGTRRPLERADAVILDLEDAVAPAAKATARGALIESRARPRPVDRARQPAGHRRLRRRPRDAVADRLPDDHGRQGRVARSVSRASTGGSTSSRCARRPRGVAHAEQIAAPPNVVGLMWGAEDLVASLGGTSSRKPNGRYRDVAAHARARVLLAAGARRQGRDRRGAPRHRRRRRAWRSRRPMPRPSGFTATACIHPSQVDVIRARTGRTNRRSTGRTACWLPRGRSGGVFTYEGRMVDEPVLRQARAVLVRGQSPSD